LPARKNAIANVRQCRLLSPPVRPLAVTLAVQAVSGLAQAVRFFWPFLRIAACRQAVLTRPLRHNSISLLLLSATCAADRTDPANGRICPPSHSCGAAAMYSQRAHSVLCNSGRRSDEGVGHLLPPACSARRAPLAVGGHAGEDRVAHRANDWHSMAWSCTSGCQTSCASVNQASRSSLPRAPRQPFT
jgi:hypothetical protein